MSFIEAYSDRHCLDFGESKIKTGLQSYSDDTALQSQVKREIDTAIKPPADNEPMADTWTAPPELLEERRRILTRPPERLSFLAPCPLCHGRAFLHIDGGGFVCRACQPGMFGHPVEAAGPAERLSHPKDIDLHDVGEHPAAAAEITPPATIATITEEQAAIFAVAWPWIKKNHPALLAAGWTMASLVRRARYRWPYGPWGVAWLPPWCFPGLKVEIGRRGGIVFTFPSSGRIITQTAWPEQNTSRHQHISEDTPCSQ